MNTRELREKRANLISEARAVLDLARDEEREITAEEDQQWDGLIGEADQLMTTITREERQAEAERGLGNPVTPPIPPEPGQEDRRLKFVSRAMCGLNDRAPAWFTEPEWRELFGLAGEDRQAAFSAYLRRGASITPDEMRALQADADTLGGYLVAPVQFVDGIIQAVDNAVYMRQWATMFAVPNAESLGGASLDTDPADPTWTSELLIGSEDSSMAIGKRELNPHPLAKYIKISRKLMRKVPDVDGLVTDRLGYKFGVTAETAYLTGSGANQPLGVFTASADGISTGRDVSTGNTTTSIMFDGLIEAKYTLKSQYWPRARWIFHRDGQKQIAKLQDGNGQYLWRESVRVGEPDRVLGLPVFMSEYAPSTFTTGLYVGILGDFSFYWIADALNMEFQRLVELYAATNQIGIIGRLESDGMPVLEEAFVRVKLA